MERIVIVRRPSGLVEEFNLDEWVNVIAPERIRKVKKLGMPKRRSGRVFYGDVEIKRMKGKKNV